MIEFIIGYSLGFITAAMLLMSIIYWPEIRAWISDKREWVHVKWILWKYR